MNSDPLGIDTSAAVAAKHALEARVFEYASGLDWCFEHSEIIDGIVRQAIATLQFDQPSMPPISVVAVGGYGRNELAPHSDLDIIVIPLDEAHPQVDSAVRKLYLALVSASSSMQMELGYSYRLTTDPPGLDPQSRTALLDARLIAGSHLPFETFMELFWDTFPVGDFLHAKLEERALAWAKTNDTPLVVEPHLKEGAGGLRCFQAANWIGTAIGNKPTRPSKPYDRVLQMRNLLHQVSGRRTDHFTRPRQTLVADRLGTDVFEMGSKLAADLSALHSTYRTAVESLQDVQFQLTPDVISVRGEARVLASATGASAALGVAKATALGLKVSSLSPPIATLGDGSMAMEAISQGERTIRNLDRAHLLDSILPELTACRTLLPRDSLHTFTVFEHTLRVVANLDAASEHAFYGELLNSLSSKGPLYLAALLHDVGKVSDDVPHSESGESIATKVGRRWSIGHNATELVSWLVRHHLLMAHTIRMRDVNIPETIGEFVQTVNTLERLTKLTLLTWADALAVGPGSWTAAQDVLLKELFEAARDRIEKPAEPASDASAAKARLIKKLTGGRASQDVLQSFIENLPAHYLLGTPAETIAQHFEFASEAAQGEILVDQRSLHDAHATEFTVCCIDQPGLLSRILAVLYAYDLNLLGIRASTTGTSPPVALDVFTCTFGDRIVPSATTKQVLATLERVLRKEVDPDELLKERGKDPDRHQQIFQWSFIEGSPGILEVRAPKGRGMAYRLSRFVASLGWDTHAARVGQWAGRGAAAFYVAGPNGEKLTKAVVDAALLGQV